MKHYNTILFDLDGTISNSKEGITKCVQYALSKFGIGVDDLDSLEHFIGPPLRESFAKFYGFTKEEAEKATAFYRERYEPIGIYECKMYPGVDEMLSEFKKEGKTIALATSKPQEMAEEMLRYFKISQYFDYIMGSEKKGPRQTKTDVLQALFEQMRITDDVKSGIVLVGDTHFDVDGAKNTGIDCIGVKYGFGTEESLLEAGAVAVVDDVKELIKIINEV